MTAFGVFLFVDDLQGLDSWTCSFMLMSTSYVLVVRSSQCSLESS